MHIDSSFCTKPYDVIGIYRKPSFLPEMKWVNSLVWINVALWLQSVALKIKSLVFMFYSLEKCIMQKVLCYEIRYTIPGSYCMSTKCMLAYNKMMPTKIIDYIYTYIITYMRPLLLSALHQRIFSSLCKRKVQSETELAMLIW